MLDIVVEPTGSVYAALIDYGVTECSHAQVVFYDNPESYGEGAHSFVRQVEPHIVKKASVSEWPGSVAHGWQAHLVRFVLNETIAELLKTAATGLYEWIQPHLPEDLCLLRAGDEPWLVTITHEQDAYIQESASELARLAKMIPGIALAPHQGDAGDIDRNRTPSGVPGT